MLQAGILGCLTSSIWGNVFSEYRMCGLWWWILLWYLPLMYVKEWMVCTSTTFKSRPLFVENRFFRFHSIERYVQYEIAGADFDLFFYLVAPFFLPLVMQIFYSCLKHEEEPCSNIEIKMRTLAALSLHWLWCWTWIWGGMRVGVGLNASHPLRVLNYSALRDSCLIVIVIIRSCQTLGVSLKWEVGG